MSTQPTDALELLREIYADLVQGAIPNADDPWWQKARAVLAKWGQPAQAAEPVAWRDPWTGTKVTTDYDAYGKHGIPLVRQQAGARESLTDEQIDRAIAELGLNYLADAHATNRAVLRKLCHHAHGIKGGQHGTE